MMLTPKKWAEPALMGIRELLGSILFFPLWFLFKCRGMKKGNAQTQSASIICIKAFSPCVHYQCCQMHITCHLERNVYKKLLSIHLAHRGSRGSDHTPSWWPFPERCWPPGYSCHCWCELGSGRSDSPRDSPGRSPFRSGCSHFL